jgi:hypothetical protein
MSGAGSSFSVATTIFVSLAICAIISYGIFYYFKQRISVIEQSQMEQARIMQSFIARSIMQQHGGMQQYEGVQCAPEPPVQKEVTVTKSGLIEVSSESDREDDSSSSETESDSDSEYESESESECETRCVQIHDHDQLLHDQLHDQIEVVVADAVITANADKKIISLNKGALGQEDNESESSDSDNSDDSSNQDPQEEQEDLLELKIGYKHNKNNAKKATQAQSIQLNLNYGNMSVSALRQLAKERSLVGEDGDLQKLKKKELIQLLQ